MQRQSKMVLARLKSSAEVEASVNLNAVDVGHKLDDRFVQFLASREGEPQRPPAQDNLLILRDVLATSRQNLGELDNQHVESLRKFLEKRAERDGHAVRVYGTLGVVHRTMADLFEPDSIFVLAGIETPISRYADQLLKQSDLAIERLKSPDMVLPPAQVEGIQVDPKTLVEGLESKVEQLRASHTELVDRRRAVQRSRQRKNAALEEHDRTFLWTARTLEGYYRLAGEDKLAQEIRPSTHRPGRRAIEVAAEETGESPDSPSSEGVAAEQTSPEAPASDDAAVSPETGTPETGTPVAGTPVAGVESAPSTPES